MVKRFLTMGCLMLLAFSLRAKHVFKGQWICGTTDVNVAAAPLFRDCFVSRNEGRGIKKATLYICGLGYYECKINSKPVTDAVLKQGFTKYDSRVLYDTYDVTRLMTKGENCMDVELGNGWFNYQSRTIWGFDRIGWRKSPRLICDLVIGYTDGKNDTIPSDASWKWTTGGSQFNSLIAGEIYDARKEIAASSKAGDPTGLWKASMVTASPGGVLVAQTMPPVRVIREIKPVSLRELGDGLWLYDMGENFAGVAEIKVSGKAGDSLILQYSELLGSNGQVYMKHNAGHMIGPATDPKFATDIYVLKGGGREVFRPRFTYHGFRYVQVQAPNSIKLSKSSLTGLFYSTDFKPVGLFKSSSEMLNKLNAAAIQSYRSNYVSIPTDCPQREKMGWLADAHLLAELGLWNFDAVSGYRKFLGDIRDVQLPDGNLPGIAPTKGIGYSWIDPEDRDFGPGWGSALPLLAWETFLFLGDTAALSENFPAVRKYVDFLASRARATGYIYRTGLDDFLSPEKTPKAFTSTIFLYRDAQVLSKMAGVLEFSSDQSLYSRLADSILTAFSKEFFDPSVGSYKVQTSTALSGALVNGLCPAEAVGKVAADLAAGLRKRDFVLDFGVFGTKWVLSALSDNGYADEAFLLLSNPKAGWGKWIADGHTTLLEGWEPKDQSLNHVFFGDFSAWYFRALAGIKLNESAAGLKRFGIAPVFPKGLDWVEVKHRGIRLKWEKSRIKSGMTTIGLEVTVPEDSVADLKIKGYERVWKAGKHKLVIRNMDN